MRPIPESYTLAGAPCDGRNQGKDYVETAHVASCHLFNHQTHHRAQVHVMLSQTSTPPPALDLHRILNP